MSDNNINNNIPNAYAVLSTLFTIVISDKLSIDRQNVVGNFLEALGQNILTVAAAQQLQQNNPNPSIKDIENLSIDDELELLKEKIRQLEEKMSKEDK